MTLAAIRGALRQQLISLLEIPETHIRENYPADSSPFAKKDETTLYYYVAPADDPINRQIDTVRQAGSNNSLRQTVSYNRVLQMYLTAYGPDGYDLLTDLRLKLMAGAGGQSPLRTAGLYIIPEIAEPNILWEPYQNQWFQRSDLQFKCNQLATIETGIPYVEVADIVLMTEQQTRNIDLEGDD
jgi:hypothetical protein